MPGPRLRWLSAVPALAAAACAHAEPAELAPGQAWSFADAPTEEARIVIGHVESFLASGRTAVSVAIVGLPQWRGDELTNKGDVLHIAFDEAALRPHLIEKLDDAALPEYFESAHIMWDDAVYGESAGLETDPPAKILTEKYGIRGNAD